MQRVFGQKLEGFTLKFENGDYGAMVTSIESPEIKRRTQDATPGGLIGTLKTTHGFEELTFKITLQGMSDKLFKLLQGRKIAEHRLLIFAAFPDEYDGGLETMVQTIQGRVVSATIPGEFQADENSECEFELALTYWRLEYAGTEKICLDYLNNIARFDGEDEYTDHRRALGYA